MSKDHIPKNTLDISTLHQSWLAFHPVIKSRPVKGRHGSQRSYEKSDEKIKKIKNPDYKSRLTK